MTEPAEYRALTAAVAELRVTNATLTGAVESLQAMLQRIEKNTVSVERHEALVKDVADLEVEARTGIARNDSRWEKLLWFVFLIVLGALLGVVVTQGGGFT
jgi:hypothetical protein